MPRGDPGVLLPVAVRRRRRAGRRRQLDDHVEVYLERHGKLKVDFEIGDALDKLERLKLVESRAAVSGRAARPAPRTSRGRPTSAAVLNSKLVGLTPDARPEE